MSNEGRSPKGRGPQHTTHHDDCGCLSARYEARLDAQRAATASLEALNRKHAEMYAKEIDRHEAQIAALKHDEATLLEDNDYLRQRIATLEAERGEWRAAAGREIAIAYAHANALRDALDDCSQRMNRAAELLAHYTTPNATRISDAAYVHARSILAQTPAASLAAHDAELWQKAAHIAHNWCLVPPDGGAPTEDEARICEGLWKHFNALAAQEVKPHA